MKVDIQTPGPEVERFERCQDGVPRSKVGLSQFLSRESTGGNPAKPDPYFIRLLNGKKWWEYTVNQYAAQYGTWEWPGWKCLEEDFREDRAGLEQIFRRVNTRVGHTIHSEVPDAVVPPYVAMYPGV